MLKKFFISMLGTMAGLWLSLIVLVFFGIMAVTILAIKGSTSPSIGDKGILHIKLEGSVPERQAELSISDLMSYADQSTEDLASILKAVRLAADDKKIKGIYIDCASSSMGVASRTELVEALADFKKSGKWIYAYADNYDQGDYYIASVADSLYLNPVGMLDVRGLASQTMFFKDLLTKLGIQVEVVRVGSFKSAVEPFMRMDMSPESRLQTSVYLQSLWGVMTSSIAKHRHLKDQDEVNNWADSLTFSWDPERYVAVNAVSALCYRSQVEDALRSRLGLKEHADLPLVSPSDYLSANADELISGSSAHVAVLYAVGDIVESGTSGIVGDAMVPLIQEITQDQKVKALVLRVNSPGGSAFASEQIWHALEQFKATGRPFYVSMGDYAASGGYYISCGADVIYSDPTTITGSIGIFGIIPNAQELVEKKIGLGLGLVQTNPNATFPSYLYSATATQRDAMQEMVNRGYDTFTSRVSMGRHIPVDSVKAIGGGRVWDGLSAKRIGLVDSIGSLQAAVADIAAKVGLSEKDVKAYPEIKSSAITKLIKESTKDIDMGADTPLTDEGIRDIVDYLRCIKDIDPLQARMEYLMVK